MATWTNNNATYYINPAYLTFVENSGYGANLIQVSASSSCYISVYIPGVIDYSDADKNYKRWKITAYNNKFPDNGKFYIYARLEKDGTSALIVYDKTLRGVHGGEIVEVEDEFGQMTKQEGEFDENHPYFYIHIGEVSETDGQRVRNISYDTGYLTSDKGSEDSSALNEMWGLDKYVTPWLIRAKQWLHSFTVKGFIKLMGGIVFSNGESGNEKVVTDIKRYQDGDDEHLKDSQGNVLIDEQGNPLANPNYVPINDNTIPTTKYVVNKIETLDKKFIRKDKDDRSIGNISSDKGFEVGKFESGTLGTGASMYEGENKNTYVEADFLKIRKKATFTTISVQELKHVGGEIILSPAAMICSRVEETEFGYKCYFNTEDSDGRKIYNEFKVGDFARCQTFNLEHNKYYWRYVVEIGEDYIILSKSDCDPKSDGIPEVGDNISQLGNRYDKERQNAIVLSSYGEDAPSYKQYKGINDFVLTNEMLVTKFSPKGNEITGILNIEKGSHGVGNLEDFTDEVFKAVHVGATNLLLNSGFTGDYQSESLTNSYGLDEDSELYSRCLKHWNGMASVMEDELSVSGKSAIIGSLSQDVKLINGESYVVSFKAKGSEIAVSCGNFGATQNLTSTYEKYIFKFVSDGGDIFIISGTAQICDLQLERGTIATDWNPSPYDNDRTLAEFQAFKYIQDAIQEGDTTILGGLILSSMIQLGNYKDGVMQKVNAGMSGIYNDDNDVAFWGGGTFNQAISTVMKFKENPRYKPSNDEWADMANFVVSHGGDVFLRGYINALGGTFRGSVEIANGKILLNDDGSGHFANEAVRWTKEGIMYRRSPDIIEWINVGSFSDHVIDYEYGTYFDMTIGMASTEDATYTLSQPDIDGFTIMVSLVSALTRRAQSAILSGKFRVNAYDKESQKYTTIDCNSFQLSRESNVVYQLTWKSGSSSTDSYWFITGGNASVKNGAAIAGKQDVVIIGGEGEDGESAGSRVVITEDKVSVQSVEADKYSVQGLNGMSKNISITDNSGTHTFEYVSGISTGYSFIERTIDENEVVKILKVTELPENPDPNTMYVII